jgi:hypothetical protein
MSRQRSLDDMKQLRLVNDTPIRLLLLVEAISNLGFIVFIFLYPSSFLAFFLKPDIEITPLACQVLFWWNAWLLVITGLMFAAVPSKYNTPTLTAGLVHVRRFLYWGLLSTEIILAYLLISTRHRTFVAIASGIFMLCIAIGRLIVLFPKQAWFGTVLIEPFDDKGKQQ